MSNGKAFSILAKSPLFCSKLAIPLVDQKPCVMAQWKKPTNINKMDVAL